MSQMLCKSKKFCTCERNVPVTDEKAEITTTFIAVWVQMKPCLKQYYID